MEYNSVSNFYEADKEIHDFIFSILWLSQYIENLTCDLPEESKAKIKSLEHSFTNEKNGKVKYLFELCFIRQFAAFEAFMYDFLKNLYEVYPRSVPEDMKISIKDIIKWKDVKGVHEYITDHCAIENSYDIESWEKTLKNTYNIDAFESPEQKQQFIYLNVIRNSILHSGGRTNSKSIREFMKLYKEEFNEIKSYTFFTEKWEIDSNFLFGALHQLSTSIVKRLANQLPDVTQPKTGKK